MRFLEPKEVTRLAEAHPPPYRLLVLTAAYVGLRWGELVGLSLGSVDLPLAERSPWSVNSSRSTDGLSTVPRRRGPAFVQSASPRASPASSASTSAPPPSSPRGSRSQVRRGAPLRRSNYRRVWSKATEKAGLAGLRFHELRHTSMAQAVAQGAHPLAIKERLGHSSITVTMDSYGRLFPRLEEAIAEGLDGVFRESTAGPLRDQRGTTASLRRSAKSPSLPSW